MPLKLRSKCPEYLPTARDVNSKLIRGLCVNRLTAGTKFNQVLLYSAYSGRHGDGGLLGTSAFLVSAIKAHSNRNSFRSRIRHYRPGER